MDEQAKKQAEWIEFLTSQQQSHIATQQRAITFLGQIHGEVPQLAKDIVQREQEAIDAYQKTIDWLQEQMLKL